MGFGLKNGVWTLKAGPMDYSLVELVTNHARAFYLYDLADALSRAELFLKSGFAVHYAMKANSDPRLLRQLSRVGLGVDVVSLGEMQKAIANGFSPKQLIFSGVAKDREELEAALAQEIFQINVESFPELQLLHQICVEKRLRVDIGLRLNIHLAAPTHAHVQTATPDAKFGIDLPQLPEILTWLKGKNEICLKAIATHIGSQILDLGVFARMAKQMGKIYRELQQANWPLERLDLGGGLGIDYQTDGEQDLDLSQNYLKALALDHGTDAQVLIAPGRFLVARMGVLLAKVIYVKKTGTRNFAILNAGMNCLLRPALYQAYHRIEAIKPAASHELYTVVGPICESTDQFASERQISTLCREDWVAIFDVGAYGVTMANTYNESPLPQQWSVLNGAWEVS